MLTYATPWNEIGISSSDEACFPFALVACWTGVLIISTGQKRFWAILFCKLEKEKYKATVKQRWNKLLKLVLLGFEWKYWDRADERTSEYRSEREHAPRAQTGEQRKFRHDVHSEMLRKFHLSAASALIKHLLSAFHVTWFFSLTASRRNAKSSLSLRSPSSSSNGVSSMVLKQKVPFLKLLFFSLMWVKAV